MWIFKINQNQAKTNDPHAIIIDPPPTGIALLKYWFLPKIAERKRGVMKKSWPAMKPVAATFSGILLELTRAHPIRPKPRFKKYLTVSSIV